MKRTGTINNSATVPIIMPPTVPTPIDILPFAPTPVENANGIIPKIIDKEVISIGRKRA